MRLLVFLLLKVTEIIGVVFVPYWVGRVFDFLCHNPFDNKWGRRIGFWLQGFFCSTALLVLGFIIPFLWGGFWHRIVWLINLNWQWAGKILGK
jgi:hypothetical protein